MVTVTTIVLVVALALVLGQNGRTESFHVRNNDISLFVQPSFLYSKDQQPSKPPQTQPQTQQQQHPSQLQKQLQTQQSQQQKKQPQKQSQSNSKHQALHQSHHAPNNHNHNNQQQQQQHLPIPAMPSDNFRKMTQSQLELLANSLTRLDNPSVSKVQSMILYLPQENSYSGQLEFTPAVLYPDPTSERVFIASDAASGQAPTLPKSLSKLPGFFSAPDLLPGYPMLPKAAQTDPGVGVVEEVLCDIRFRTSALSVPLLSGSRTVGVLLVSPTVPVLKHKHENSTNQTDDGSSSSSSSSNTSSSKHEIEPKSGDKNNSWTKRDKQQVSLAAQSLSMALNMDNERTFLTEQNVMFRESLSDSLHQMKNPIQALRTYGKILQRQIVETSSNDTAVSGSGTSQLLKLAERLMVQSDRVVDMLGPMDSLVENSLVMLPPAVTNNAVAAPMVLWNDKSQSSSSSRSSSSSSSSRSTKTSNSTGTHHERTENIHGLSRRNQPTIAGDSNPPQAAHFFNTTIDEEHFQSTPQSHIETESGGPAGLQATVIGDFETEMVFITDVLEPVFDTFRAIASEQGTSFEVFIDDIDDLPGVFVAPKSFQEAASNVLDNALKYAVLSKTGTVGSPFARNPSPRVRVRIFPHDRCTRSQTPGVVVLVEDNGPGVSTSDRDKIFERGFRSESTASQVEGRGIGLDISRALMARMGGYLGLVGEEEDFDYQDGLDGAAMKLEVTRKPYKSPGR